MTDSLVGVDVGGTFTDFVLWQDGALRVHKLATSSDDQSRAILAGLSDLGVTSGDVAHGSTVATNALLERRGAKAALLTTLGFADVLAIGRQNRPSLYDLSPTRPEPLVPAALRFEVPERLDSEGRVLLPLDEAALRSLVPSLRAAGVESVAIVFLFSFRNPAHEERAGAILEELLPGVPITLSSALLPEYREYERAATTAINAYVRPPVARYLGRLAQGLDNCRARVMQSNGGTIDLERAAHQAARLVLSGPAGGVVGAFHLASQAMPGEPTRIITFDMGGTSTDVALCPGEIPQTSESTIGDLPLRLPVLDIHTVGAGGGSLASVDAGGALHAGPQSAGAMPGPACYGRGGTQATVSDANLALGRLDAAHFLAGSGDVSLDENAARRALEEPAAKLGLSIEGTALGIVRVVNAAMERALRRVSVERGHDPRDFVLVPFGGAGPLHACELGDALGMRRILIVPHPGVLSALGMLVADVRHDESRALLRPLEELRGNTAPLENAFAELATKVRAALPGETPPQLSFALDLRYRGQSYELTIPVAEIVSSEMLQAARDDFDQAHENRFGYATPTAAVEVVTLRASGTRPSAQFDWPGVPLGSPDASAARIADKPVWFEADGPTLTACYERERLRPGHSFDGPALVFQFDSTLVVASGWTARVDEWSNVWLERLAGDS